MSTSVLFRAYILNAVLLLILEYFYTVVQKNKDGFCSYYRYCFYTVWDPKQ